VAAGILLGVLFTFYTVRKIIPIEIWEFLYKISYSVNICARISQFLIMKNQRISNPRRMEIISWLYDYTISSDLQEDII
jgi:hypothetical protein